MIIMKLSYCWADIFAGLRSNATYKQDNVLLSEAGMQMIKGLKDALIENVNSPLEEIMENRKPPVKKMQDIEAGILAAIESVVTGSQPSLVSPPEG